MTTQKTRIVVVEDEALFREMLVGALSRQNGLEVVDTAEDGERAVRLARECKPDVMLMDIELPGEMDGIEASLVIKKENPGIGIVILSAHDDPLYVTSLPLGETAGWAYLLKQSVRDISAVVQAIEGCARGMVVMDPAVMARLRPREGSAVIRLTPRQQEVLRLLAEGLSNGAIARQLVLEERSVESYINVIYQHLGLSGEPEINMRVKAALAFLQSSQGSRRKSAP
ncbi:MAG: response regulator transcription factor [Dehalococcoidia bacterium]|nr:response regulator transcription factor [Dehalococcoidia bacterium]